MFTRRSTNATRAAGLLAALATPALAQPTISPHTIAAGAGTSSGGPYQVSGTIGQHDASEPMIGGSYSVTGGLWGGPNSPAPCPCPADFDNSGGTPDATDIVAFFDAWLRGEANADTDCSGGTPDLTDINGFFNAWLAGGC